MGQRVMLESPGLDEKVGTQESGVTMAMGVCNMENFIQQPGPIMRETVETVILWQAMSEMGAPVLHSVLLGKGRDRTPGTRPIQYEGSGEVASPTSGAQSGGYTTSYA